LGVFLITNILNSFPFLYILDLIKYHIDTSKISFHQYVIIIICFLLNVIDGIDVSVISYTGPVIQSAMEMSDDNLGIIFSSGLIGMAVGALLLAPFADNIGRKKIIIISTMIITLGVFLTGFSTNLIHLIILRFFSGIGIGSMLATTTSIVSEYTPEKSKDFWISFVLAGYPVGAILSGYLSNIILINYSWELVYLIFGAFSLIFIPIVYLYMSESLVFLKRNHSTNSLIKINKILVKLNYNKNYKFSDSQNTNHEISILNLFSKKYLNQTFKLWIAFFFSFGCLYFLLSWIPKLVSEYSTSLSLGISAGTVFNLGAFFGIVTQGYISSKFGLKKTILSFLVITSFIMSQIEFFLSSDLIFIGFAFLGFTIQGGFVGLYSIAARIYPGNFRTTGIGWGIGIGRLGAILAPYMAGIFISYGIGISANFMIFAITALISATITYFITIKH